MTVAEGLAAEGTTVTFRTAAYPGASAGRARQRCPLRPQGRALSHLPGRAAREPRCGGTTRTSSWTSRTACPTSRPCHRAAPVDQPRPPRAPGAVARRLRPARSPGSAGGWSRGCAPRVYRRHALRRGERLDPRTSCGLGVDAERIDVIHNGTTDAVADENAALARTRRSSSWGVSSRRSGSRSPSRRSRPCVTESPACTSTSSVRAGGSPARREHAQQLGIEDSCDVPRPRLRGREAPPARAGLGARACRASRRAGASSSWRPGSTARPRSPSARPVDRPTRSSRRDRTARRRRAGRLHPRPAVSPHRRRASWPDERRGDDVGQPVPLGRNRGPLGRDPAGRQRSRSGLTTRRDRRPPAAPVSGQRTTPVRERRTGRPARSWPGALAVGAIAETPPMTATSARRAPPTVEAMAATEDVMAVSVADSPVTSGTSVYGQH